MKRLCKSRYTRFCKCQKNLWLNANKSEMAIVDTSTEARFESGNEVGDLAMELFGSFCGSYHNERQCQLQFHH